MWPEFLGRLLPLWTRPGRIGLAAPSDSHSIVEAPAQGASAADARPALSALLAEDNDVNAIVVSRLLESLDCRVTRVATGADALQAIEEGSFDIVFFDWRMPEMDGLEATRRLRRTTAHATLPIVIVTANARAEDREACLAVGADGYLAKPVRADELRETLDRLVPRGVERASRPDEP